MTTNTETEDRVNAVAAKVQAAQERADRLRLRDALDPKKAESATKMRTYLDGALAAVAERHWSGARYFAGWAEYEAGRVLST